MKHRSSSLRLCAAFVVPVWSLSIAAHADGLADPMRPMNVPTKTATGPIAPPIARLTAIFVSAKRRVAIFDGRVVQAGDRVGDIQIEEVLSDGVRYLRAGKIEIARLPRQAVTVRSDVRKVTVAKE